MEEKLATLFLWGTPLVAGGLLLWSFLQVAKGRKDD